MLDVMKNTKSYSLIIFFFCVQDMNEKFGQMFLRQTVLPHYEKINYHFILQKNILS